MSPNTGTGTRFEVRHELDEDGRAWIVVRDDEDASLTLTEGAAPRPARTAGGSVSDPRQVGETDIHWRRCPYCETKGCEECDGTGFKYRAVWTTADGLTLSLTGSGKRPAPETKEAIEAIARNAALAKPGVP